MDGSQRIVSCRFRRKLKIRYIKNGSHDSARYIRGEMAKERKNNNAAEETFFERRITKLGENSIYPFLKGQSRKMET